MRGNDAERLANGSKSLNGRGTDVGIPGALSSVEVSGTDHGRTQGQERYNLRARAGRKSGAAYADEEEKERPTGLEAPKGNSNGNGNANGNANGHASHPPTTSARKHVNRLRSGSFVPSFVERPLDKDDPRAIRFQEVSAHVFSFPIAARKLNVVPTNAVSSPSF